MIYVYIYVYIYVCIYIWINIYMDKSWINDVYIYIYIYMDIDKFIWRAHCDVTVSDDLDRGNILNDLFSRLVHCYNLRRICPVFILFFHELYTSCVHEYVYNNIHLPKNREQFWWYWGACVNVEKYRNDPKRNYWFWYLVSFDQESYSTHLLHFDVSYGSKFEPPDLDV